MGESFKGVILFHIEMCFFGSNEDIVMIGLAFHVEYHDQIIVSIFQLYFLNLCESVVHFGVFVWKVYFTILHLDETHL